MYPTRGFTRKAAVLFVCFTILGCSAPLLRKSGDYVTSDLINSRIAVGPVVDGRSMHRDELPNRKISLTTEEIQREFAEGLSEVHRGANISQIGDGAGFQRSLQTARQVGAEVLIMPSLEQLFIDEVGRNGLEPVADIADVLLFPITLGEALITQGERAGMGHHYIPIYDVMVTMKMKLDFYRVSDGTLVHSHSYPRNCYVKANKDNIEGSRFDPTDDFRRVGRETGRFLVREFAKEVAKYDINEMSDELGIARR